MAKERNDFNVNLGDVMYSDSAVPGVPVALTLQDKWAKYRLNLSYPNLRLIRSETGLYSHWDDHEFIDDFSIPQYGQALYASGKKAFLDYSPGPVQVSVRALPQLPLGQEPRDLLPRRALLPQPERCRRARPAGIR